MKKAIFGVVAAAAILFGIFYQPAVGGLNPARPSGGGGGGVALGTVTPAFKDKTFQTAGGAQMATGSLRLTGDAFLLDANDVIEINDGQTTTTITFGNFAGGGTNYSAGTLTIDNGGGLAAESIAAEIFWGWLLVMENTTTTLMPACDVFGSVGGGFSPKTRCITYLSDGTATSSQVFFINTEGGTSGNQSISVSSTRFTATGMSGGAN